MLKKFKCNEAASGADPVISSNRNLQPVRLYSSISATGVVGTNAKIIKTEPIDFEMLNLEEKDLHHDHDQIMNDSDGELITTSSNNTSLAHSARYHHVQIQTMPAPQQGASLGTSSSTQHKVILATREEYMQHASLGGGDEGEGADTGGGGGVGGEATIKHAYPSQNANEPPKLPPNIVTKHMMPRVSRSPQTQGTSLLVNAGSSSQVIITRTLPSTPISAELHGPVHGTHLQRRHSVSPSHYHRTALSSTPPPSLLHQPLPLSLQKQNVRVIRDGRLCEETASTTVLTRRRSISPPPLLHHVSRSAPVSPVVARRCPISLHEPGLNIDAEQHVIGNKQQHAASMAVQYQHQLSLSPSQPPPPHRPLNTSSIPAASAAGTITISSTTSQQQHHQFDASPTRKCVVTSRHVNVISPINAAQDQHHHYPTQQNSPQHHQHHQHNVNMQATSSTSPVSAACPSTPTSSSNDLGQVFRTPDVSSSSSSSSNRNSSLNNVFNTAMRPPPPPPPKIKNTSPSCSSMSISLGNSNCRNNSGNGSPSGSNSEEPSSSIPDLEFDGTTVLCRVCGDKASGFHYGVHSCEGCKGFFRRSIQQKIQYRPCTKNQQCSILRINRNRCQYCRLKKCIAVGMSRDAVRFGRVPKREKARILAAMQQSTQNRGQQRALATELDDQPRLLAAVLRAHLETCEFTKEKVAAMRQRARECPSYSMPTLLACPLNPAPELQSEQEFSQRFAHVIRGVIDFAGMIPGFQLLTQDDKFTLLKAGLFDALFVRLICMFDSSINSIICLNGQVMRRDAIQNGANARFLVDSTFNFAERMNSMNLSDAEIGLFCAIVLITPDRPGLRNIELIEKMYSRLKGCLQKIISQNRPDQPDFMAKLLDTMPDLRTLSTLHTEKLVVFRTEHKELLRQQMWNMEEEQPQSTKSPGSNWDDTRMEVEAKSPLGSVSSTESGDMDYNTSLTNQASQHNHTNNQHPVHQPSPLAASTPLLAASLSGTCPLRNRATSGPLADSNVDLDIVGSHAHLTQNGLTITPIVRSHSHQQLHHHLTAGTQHRYRKLDSPTDSGIESGNEKNECGSKTVSSGGSSSCSSPRSSVDDALDCTDATAASTSQVTVSVSPVRSPQPAAPTSTSSAAASKATSPSTLKRQIVEDMPVLKRVLQAPPLYDTNSLMDEAYKPHKKFRALRHRELETGEADASSTSSNINGRMSATNSTTAGIVANNSAQISHTVSNSPPTTIQTTVSTGLPQKVVTSAITSPNILPVVATHQQSQLHMHLTRQTAANTNGNSNIQQQHSSSLSSTHSVLAKSLMAEPRMTPEQMKRSDIIQNYIMRDPIPSSSTVASNLLGMCTPTGQGNRSPASTHHMVPLHQAHHQTTTAHQYITTSSNSSPTSSSSPACLNSTCVSPSTTTVTLASPPPPPCGAAIATSVTTRWNGHSVITTTSINQRRQSVSPSSNGSSSSSSSGCQYFQSPHSTSASVSPPRPSPSTLHSPPRLIELQVDIADAQQPLNLSKKSPTPPPNKLQTLVAAASAAQRFPAVSADITVTATNVPPPPTVASPSKNTQQIQVHKVLLEA